MSKNRGNAINKIILAALFCMCFLSLGMSLQASALYVATDGSDANSGTIDRPFRTIQHAADAAVCGDTVNIRAGIYDGGMGVRYGKQSTCSSYSNAITVQANPGEIVTLTNKGVNAVLGFSTDSYPTHRNFYWIVKGLIVDGAGMSSPGFAINGLSGDHVRLQNLEVRNSAASGILPHGDFWEFLNLNVHNNGSSGQDHGLYWTGQGGLIDGGSYHDNSGYGIQIYDSGSVAVRNNVVRNARIYNNNLTKGGTNPLVGVGAGGIVIANGTNNSVYNSLFYNNGASSIQINGTCISCSAYNNTIFGGFTGIQIVDRFATGTVIKNNISFGNVGSAISDAGTGTVLSNNLTSDPGFTNPAARDFSLQASSSAINAGADLSSIFATDLTGKPRPVGGAFDIGAFEYGSATYSDPVLPTVSITATSSH